MTHGFLLKSWIFVGSIILYTFPAISFAGVPGSCGVHAGTLTPEGVKVFLDKNDMSAYIYEDSVPGQYSTSGDDVSTITSDGKTILNRSYFNILPGHRLIVGLAQELCDILVERDDDGIVLTSTNKTWEKNNRNVLVRVYKYRLTTNGTIEPLSTH
jgi:hypothetical protein